MGKVSQTLHDCNLACGVQMHTTFDDLDHDSVSQVCQKHNKLQIVVFTILDCCLLLDERCIVATYINVLLNSFVY